MISSDVADNAPCLFAAKPDRTLQKELFPANDTRNHAILFAAEGGRNILSAALLAEVEKVRSFLVSPGSHRRRLVFRLAKLHVVVTNISLHADSFDPSKFALLGRGPDKRDL